VLVKVADLRADGQRATPVALPTSLQPAFRALCCNKVKVMMSLCLQAGRVSLRYYKALPNKPLSKDPR
jgi:hypothetical protein